MAGDTSALDAENVLADGSVRQPASFETINLQSVGIAFSIAWFAIVLWSPVAIHSNVVGENADLYVHLLRCLMIVSVNAIYLLVRCFRKLLRSSRAKHVLVLLACVASPLVLLGNISPTFAQLTQEYPAVNGLCFALAGVTAGVNMLVWGYDMPTKVSYRQGVVNIAAGSMFSGLFYILCMFVDKSAAAVLCIMMPIISTIMWISYMHTENASNVVSNGSSAHTNLSSALGNGSDGFIFSYGCVMGLAGAIGTAFEVTGFSWVYIGLATFLAGLAALVSLRYFNVTVSSHMLIWFFPFAAACLFLLSILDIKGQQVLLFAVFFIVTAANVINTAYPDNSKHAADSAVDLLRVESRFADMLGSLLGWTVGTVIQFALGTIAPYCYFLLAVILVAASSYSATKRQEELEAAAVARQPIKQLSISEIWDKACEELSETYSLSAREAEVFTLLSHGRDRQRIHEELQISLSTVRTHTYNIYRKMDIHSQQQLIDVVEGKLRNLGQAE